jgi:hypothetical protein
MEDNVINLADSPLLQREQGFADEFLDQLARVRILQPVYPLFHANVIRNALEAAIPTADGMIVDVGKIETVGDCRYAIETRDHAGQKYRITVAVERNP